MRCANRHGKWKHGHWTLHEWAERTWTWKYYRWLISAQPAHWASMERCFNCCISIVLFYYTEQFGILDPICEKHLLHFTTCFSQEQTKVYGGLESSTTRNYQTVTMANVYSWFVEYDSVSDESSVGPFHPNGWQVWWWQWQYLWCSWTGPIDIRLSEEQTELLCVNVTPLSLVDDHTVKLYTRTFKPAMHCPCDLFL